MEECKFFDDWEKFKKFTGLIDNYDRLVALGIEPDDDRGSYQPCELQKLKEFVAKNPRYHIITQTSDSDDVETELENEGRSVIVDTMSNEIRFVNRMSYFIGTGSEEPAELIEIEDRD